MADRQLNPADQGIKVLNTLSKNADLFTALPAIGVVLMLIIPVAPFVLDVFLLLNFSLAFLIILSTIYVTRPSDFSAFPTLILLTTVFSLALNVSSTRLILTQGQAGNVISAFGNFVAGGNLVVGFIIFIVLLVIQLLVITRGATRVSEVSARFALDSLPGKQLTINEELNSGSITPEEATAKRAALGMEAGFYGAMDGASKFVSGNNQVAIVIVIVNIIGGLIMGTIRGEGLGAAAQRYTILTIGDGLVSQIPSLLISVATGIIVTRNSSDDRKFAQSVSQQIVMMPRTLYITGGAITLIGFLPGFPFFLNLLIGLLLVGSGWLMAQNIKNQGEALIREQRSQAAQEDVQPTIQDILHVDPMSLEIGFSLIPLVDASQGGDLLERIKQMRRNIGLDLGILVPPIRITDNVSVSDKEYVIKIRGEEIGRGEIQVNMLLALNPRRDLNLIEGIEGTDPTFGLPAKWIRVEDRIDAEREEFSVYDPPSVLSTHLTELIRRNAADLLTRQDVQSMLDALKKEFSALVDEVLKVSNVGEVHKILQALLKERVKIRNMTPILETIADYRKTVPHIDHLVEQIRQVLGKQICADPSVSANNIIRALQVSPEWEEILTDSLSDSPTGFQSDLTGEQSNSFVYSAGEEIEKRLQAGVNPVVLCSSRVRRLVREILSRSFPNTPVLAYPEIPSQISVEQLGLIKE